MKKNWITIFALSANLSAFAQGQVNFNTHVLSDIPPIDLRFAGPDGVPWTEGFGQLAIVGNSGSLASVVPLIPVASFQTSASEAGYFNAGTATAPAGFPGGTVVTMVLRAWLGGAGSTFDSSTWRSQSAPFSVSLTEPPNKPGDLIGLGTGIVTLIPEPTTLALITLGIGALLLRRRR